MKIVVIGTGGVGAYYGIRLIQAGHEVHFVSTPRHVEAVRAHGLILSSGAEETVVHPASIAADPWKIGQADLVLVTVKLYQLEEATAEIGALMGSDTIVVPLQNGVYAPDFLAQRVGADHVCPGIAFIIAYLVGAGHVEQPGGRPGLTVSSRTMSGKDSPRCRELADSLRGVGVGAEMAEDIDRALWRKYALIVTFGGVCALVDSPLGPVRTYLPTRALLEQSLEEIRLVAASRGVTLSEEDTAGVMTSLDSAITTATTSMQRDIAEGKPSELEYLNGELVRMADLAGIPVPLQRAVVAVLGFRSTTSGAH